MKDVKGVGYINELPRVQKGQSLTPYALLNLKSWQCPREAINVQQATDVLCTHPPYWTWKPLHITDLQATTGSTNMSANIVVTG